MRVINIKVKLHARTSRLEEQPDGNWVAHLKAPPVDGKANTELLVLVAQHFGVRRADVALKSGATSRTKHVAIGG